MVKSDKSTDGQYWAFRAQEYNQVLFSKNVRFFLQGAMWRSAPGPRSSKLFTITKGVTHFRPISQFLKDLDI